MDYTLSIDALPWPRPGSSPHSPESAKRAIVTPLRHGNVDKEKAMSSSEIQKTRVINELRDFIRKLLQDTKILEQSLEIARRHLAEGSRSDVTVRIANEISETTSVHIPEDPAEHSEADKLFLELLREVVNEEQALY